MFMLLYFIQEVAMISYCDFFEAGIRRIDPSVYISGVIGFAGSRSYDLPAEFCDSVIRYFEQFGCTYAVGCQQGVDESFRSAIAMTAERMALSSVYRAHDTDDLREFDIAFTSPASVPYRARYALRTIELVQSVDLLIVFSPRPLGHGSSLAVRTAVRSDIPALVVSC